MMHSIQYSTNYHVTLIKKLWKNPNFVSSKCCGSFWDVDALFWRYENVNKFCHSLLATQLRRMNYVHPDFKVICHLRSVRTSYAVEAVWENLSRFPAFGDLRFACLSSATEERDIEREGERAAAWLAMAWLSLDRNFDCPAAASLARRRPAPRGLLGRGLAKLENIWRIHHLSSDSIHVLARNL